jgi:hypothetical protein
VATTKILPNIGSPVSSPAFDESAAENMSIGEAAYAATFFLKIYAKKLADPAAAHDIAQFLQASGADWSGFQSDSASAPAEHSEESDAAAPDTEPPAPDLTETASQQAHRIPMAPDNYYDSLPAMAHMLRQQQAAMDAAVTHFAAHINAVIDDQQTMLGAPEGIKPYRDGTAYFREVLKISTAQTKKIFARVPYVTWTPGKDPGWLAYQPAMPEMAASFADGKVPGENLDRIVGMDQDMTKYVQKTNASPEDKADVMAAFAPALVDAAETATPDELSKEKTRWANAIAHALDPDGPPVAEAIRKQADNAIRTRSYADGSGLISMHATGPVFAQFKNWSLYQVNGNGTQVELDSDLIDLLKTDNDEDDQAPTAADTFNDLNDLKTTPDPQATAEDEHGNTIPADQVAAIDKLSTGQRLAAIVLGMFQTMLTMDPAELGAKSAHGTAAQLMIIQDIQTAYETLGVGALPEAVRRPPGPVGILPPITSQPNPDDPDTPICEDPTHTRGHSPPSWTQYMSEAINIGAFHPRHAEQLACDSKLVGQIWNGHHDVLVQHRAKRLFTPAQRRGPGPRPGMSGPWLHGPGGVLPDPPHHRMAQRGHHRCRQRHHRLRTPPRGHPRREMADQETSRSHVLPTRPLARPHPTPPTQPLLESLGSSV